MKHLTKKAFNNISPLLVLVILMAACSGPGSNSSDFAAYYSNYGSPDEITGPFADVVIRFPDHKTLVFSRETSYLPFLEYGDERWSVKEIIPQSLLK